ncbi:homocysteine S-methyltransferase family protein [bacterium]|nr:homocysteine S-methyltransferase family protein [bacterium]
MGTMLQQYGAGQGCLELVSLENPSLMKEIHREYVAGGADIITTNTFGASRIKLASYGLQDRAVVINRTAAGLAKESAGSALVAGSIGPTGKLVTPLGDIGAADVYEAFREQAAALCDGGADLLLMETFGDLKELKIAIMAARHATGLPILAAMTYEETFLSFTGTGPETAAVVIAAAGADVIGVNCSTGPAPMLEIVGRYAVHSSKPVFVEPNAGLPSIEDDEDTYRVTPDEMAAFSETFVQLGANIVGSCCGSTPEYTRAIRNAVKGMKPVVRHVDPCLRLAGRTVSVSIGSGLPFAVIGERINPTNRDDLAESLREKQAGIVIREAESQVEQGASLLDVNVGVPGIDEPEVMGMVVEALESSISVPLVIDSTNRKAIEAALGACTGKPLINSVHGSEESLDAVLPLAARYGAAVLCLAVGEKGIPVSAAERLAVLEKIIARAEAAGIPREDLICDCLTLTVSAEQKRAEETLKATRLVREELGLPTVLGVSNISFGLPERSLINATFLSMAMGSGLDAAIVNPADRRIMETVRAASVLTVRDRDSIAFVRSHQKKKKKTIPGKDRAGRKESDSRARVREAVISGNRTDIEGLIRRVLDEGMKPVDINSELLIPAIQEVGRQYDAKVIFLPQMILAAETMQRAFTVLEPLFQSGEVSGAGTVVLCTVKGDVHDIGKNIVGLFLKNNGFSVIDIGKDADAGTIVDAALRHRADVIGLSALMTTTMTEMPEVIRKLKEAGSSAKVVVGGAVVTRAYAAKIGADGYAKDGPAAVSMIQELLSGRG